ncbi:MAG: dTDP-4-dehydrorhamnose reductase [Caulobacterales bacterium]
MIILGKPGVPILVAGASGQVARAIAERAPRHGFAPVCLGRADMDLTQPDAIHAAIDRVEPAFVVNAAAYTAVDMAESEPDAAFALNRDGAAALAKAAHDFRLPLLHVSTDYVFDGLGGAPYSERAAPRPLGVYGRSKLEGEQAVLAAHPHTIICRSSWIFSPWPKNFALTMLDLAGRQTELSVVNDQRGKPTYAPDLADALMDVGALVTALGAADVPRLLHLANSGEATWYEFAAAIFEQAKKAVRTVPKLHAIPTADYPTPAQRPLDSRLDCSAAERLLGRSMRHWRSALEDWAGRVLHG